MGMDMNMEESPEIPNRVYLTHPFKFSSSPSLFSFLVFF